MKNARSTAAQQASIGLPEVPDFPGSPLSGWKHYGILKLAENKIFMELESIGYQGRLIGLRISYYVGGAAKPENDEDLGDEYTMAFGYNVTDGQTNLIEETPPPSEEFIIGLYDFVGDMIANHISPYVPEFALRLDAAFNPTPTTYTIACRIVKAGECGDGSAHEGSRRRMLKINNGPWRCLHTKC